MGKLIGVVVRRSDLSHDAATAYWRSTHGQLALALPGLRRYIQNHAVVRPGQEPRVDGFAEVWFDDEDALRAAFRSEAGRTVLADEANFVDHSRAFGGIVREVDLMPGGGGARPRLAKLISVIFPRPDQTLDECVRYWHDVHGPLALELPGLRAYVQNHSVARPGRVPKAAGFAELWFDDEEALRSAFASETGRALIADGANFNDLDRSYGVIVTEVPLLDGSPRPS